MDIFKEFVSLLVFYLFLGGITFLVSCFGARFSKRKGKSKEMVAVDFFNYLSIFLIVLFLNTLPTRSLILRIFLLFVSVSIVRSWMQSNPQKLDWLYEELGKRINIPKRE